jgi:aminoglycoside phosphotransferase (APT) family kinase protein
MHYPATFNNILHYGYEFGSSSWIKPNCWFQQLTPFSFECSTPPAEQIAHDFESTLPNFPALESIDTPLDVDLEEEDATGTFSLSNITQIALSVLKKDSLSDVNELASGFGSKVYSLTFSDGTEAALRLPHDDDEEYSTRDKDWLYRLISCEVATMKYAKKMLPLEFAALIPTVYAWNADPNDVVGKQYILMEKMKGVRFSDAWPGVGISQKRYVAEQFARFTHALHSIGNEFTKFGSIYFDSQSDSFFVGPYVDRVFDLQTWNTSIDDGPWTHFSESFLAQLKAHLLFYSEQQLLEDDEDIDDSISLIIKHLENLSLFAAKFDESIVDGVERIPAHRSLAHFDINAHNFLVDPTTMQLTAILDWEGMGIFPDWMSVKFPRFMQSENLSRILAVMDTDESEEAGYEMENIRNWYVSERNRLQPRYSNQLEAYSKLDKIYNALFLWPENLEDSTVKWMEEELQEQNILEI